MRPHRLRMQAFGPFAGSVEVDLDRLAAGGLFLLHGQTGAGKTTLLDGLGFALFGRVPGARGRTGRLRSDHADAAVRTEVELEVTLGGRRWRITRSPAQQRAKTRGTGTTTEQARVLLQQERDGQGGVAGQWVTVSTRIDEAAAELDPLLGMSAEQFFQVVLLPQGEFARFLRAESKDRGELLQRLFGTERFRLVEDWLAARRAGTAADVAAARQQLQVLQARLAEAAGRPWDSGGDTGGSADGGAGGGGDGGCGDGGGGADGGGVGAQAPQELLRETQEQWESARQVAALATQRRDALREQAQRVTHRAALQARRRSAERAWSALEAERAVHDALGRELHAADRAAELAGVLAAAQDRARAGADAAAGLAASRSRLRDVGVEQAATLPELQAAAARARQRAGRLDGLRGLAGDLARERDAVARARREQAVATGARQRCVAVLDGHGARRDAALAALAVSRGAADALPAARAGLEQATRAVAEAGALADTESALRELRDRHLLARETAVSLREKEVELRDARLLSMVAELAGTLEDGAPCEVCGSLQHPDPYEGASDGVTREDEERARLAAEHAAREVADLGSALAAAEATATAHRARLEALGLGDDRAALRRAVARAERDVAVLVSSAAALAAAEAALAALDRDHAAAQTERVRATEAAAAGGRRAEEGEQRAERLVGRLTAELEGEPDLDTAREVELRRAERCEAAAQAVQDAVRAEAEAAAAGAAADAAAVAAGFAGPQAAAAALRATAWRQAAGERQREHEGRRAAVRAALADPELAVPLDPPAQVEEAERALAEADACLVAANGAEAAARSRLAAVRALVPEVVAARTGLVPLEERAVQVRRLADLCAGGAGNALRMTLTSFVLAARLEEVAAVASARLLQMTQGRYSLVHTDGTAKGGVRSGLGLLARDTWTGEDRDVSTLSGGETFQASLALALGLADVVQAEAGGTRIEALFVDEGFGSLDEQSLDEVMDVLDGLREGGRVVGLVSHVGELRTRIPAQVRVHKGRRGSTLSLLGC